MRTAVAALVLALSPLYVSAGFSDRKAPTTEFWKPTVGKSKDLDFGAIRELDIGWVATSATATTAVDCLTYGSAWVFNKTSGVATSYPDMTTSQQDAVRGLRADAGCGDTLIVSDFGGQGKLLEVYRKGATYCPGGIMYPIFPALNMWNPWARAFFFALVLIYLFIGVGVVSDKFMGAIEVITSSTVEAKNFRSGEIQKQQVWNSTIANLSLMALGSSAPEILLAVVETIGKLGEPAESGLGPATIVGSASFNLLVISAVCIIAIKPGGHRTVDDIEVFALTAASSVFAYIWLYFVLRISSVNVIEMWEALVTLAMFPVLIIVAYGLDSRWGILVRLLRICSCGKIDRGTAEDKVDVLKEKSLMDIWNINGKKGTVVPTGEDGDELIPIKKTVSKGHDQSHIVGTSGMGAGGFGSNDAKKKKEKSKKRVEMEEKVAAILKKHAAVRGTLDAVQLSALVQHELALSAPRSRMENRSNAIKMLTGQRQMHGQPSKDARAAMKSLKDNGGIEGGGKGSKSNDLMWGMKAHSVISVGKLTGIDMTIPDDAGAAYSAKVMWRHKSAELVTPAPSPTAGSDRGTPKRSSSGSPKRSSSPSNMIRALSVKLGISKAPPPNSGPPRVYTWKETEMVTEAVKPAADGSVTWDFRATHDAVRYPTSAFKLVIMKAAEEIGAVELQPPTKRGSQGDEELKGKFGLDDCPDPLDLEATLQMELPPLRSVVMRNAEGVAAHQAIVQLGASEYAAYEKDGVVKIKVERVGCLDGVATVHWNTSNGTGKAGARYHAGSGELIFAHHQTEQVIEVNIIDDDEYTPDLDFFVRLSKPVENHRGAANPQAEGGGAASAESTTTEVLGENDPCELALGSRIVTRVLVIDDDVPGAFGFEDPRVSVSETSTVAECHVVRTGGADGRVELKYRTVDNTAVAGEDFVAREGWLTFEHHEMLKTIEVPLIVTGKLSHHNVMFSIDLLLGPLDEDLGVGEMPSSESKPWTAGAVYSATNARTCVVAISNDQNFASIVDLVMEDLFDTDGNLTKTGWGDLQQQSWLQQFEDAIFHENSDDDDDEDDEDEDGDDAGGEEGEGEGEGDDEAKKCDVDVCTCTLSNVIKTISRMCTLFMHAISIPWNILAACAPPPGMFGGYPTFVISLAMVGFVTAVIGDVATAFGCFVGLDNGIVAITFVALGTSLPDTFASMSAAVHDSNADASLGNITGSNSVNVFLGLGLPWTIACIYYAINDKTNGILTKDFVVEAGTLGFSVVVFCCCAMVAFFILMIRRIPCIGGELGAKDTVSGRVCQWVSTLSLIGLWFLYIGLSILQNVGIIKSPSWL